MHDDPIASYAAASVCLMLALVAPVRAEKALDCFSENKDLWVPGCTALIERRASSPSN